MYQKVDTNLNFVDREKKVEEFWKENHIFEKSMENSQFFASDISGITYICIQVKENSLEHFTAEDAVIG